MARITVEKCLKNVPSRFDLILLASKRARQLASTSRGLLVETKDDKNTLIALEEIEEGLIDKETLDRTLEEDVLLDQFSSTKPSEPDVLGPIFWYSTLSERALPANFSENQLSQT